MTTPLRYGIVGVGGFGTYRRKLLRQAGCYEIDGGVDIEPAAFADADKVEGTSLVRYPSVEVAVSADGGRLTFTVAEGAHRFIMVEK